MRTLMIMIGLLCSAGWLVGQNSPKNTNTLDPRSKQDTITGCLMGSDGNLTLTDAGGIEYKLSGNTSQLSSHTRHQIEVFGKVEGAGAETTNSPMTTDTSTGTQGTGTATKQGVVQTFHISKVTRVGESCTAKKSK